MTLLGRDAISKASAQSLGHSMPEKALLELLTTVEAFALKSAE